jgi:hypothetical protein
MVRRGSTVGVRQRALQKRRTWRFSVQPDLLRLERAVGMEPFMELFASRTQALSRSRGGDEIGYPSPQKCSWRAGIYETAVVSFSSDVSTVLT